MQISPCNPELMYPGQGRIVRCIERPAQQESASMKTRIRTILASFLAAVLLPSLLPACNMAEGAGKDISAAGATITDTADDNKGY